MLDNQPGIFVFRKGEDEMQVYGISEEELKQDESDAQLRHILEAWPELTRWEQLRIVWLAQWYGFCNRFKIPGAISIIGNDFLNLLLKF